MLDKNKVNVILNKKVDMSVIEADNPDVVILASGSRPIVPRIPGVEKDYVVSAEEVLLGNKAAGNKVAVIGGGSVGVETAELLTEQKKEVYIIEMAAELLTDMSPTLKAGLLNRVSTSDIKVLTGEKVIEFKDHAVVTEKQTISDVDTVILAIGYKSNNDLADKLKESSL